MNRARHYILAAGVVLLLMRPGHADPVPSALIGAWEQENGTSPNLLRFWRGKMAQEIDGCLRFYPVHVDGEWIVAGRLDGQSQKFARFRIVGDALELAAAEGRPSRFRRSPCPPAGLTVSALPVKPRRALASERVRSIRASLEERSEKSVAVRRELRASNDPTLFAKMERLDFQDSEYLITLLGDVGWIDRRRFGRQAQHAAWLIAMHTKNCRLMRTAVRELERELYEGQLDPTAFAGLFDRYRLIIAEPQRFGMHVDTGPDGALRVGPLESIDHVDRMRTAIGLQPLEKYLERYTHQNDGRPVQIVGFPMRDGPVLELAAYVPGALFRSVANALPEDRTPAARRNASRRARFERMATSCRSFAEERTMVRAFLAEFRTSHLALFSSRAHDFYRRELLGEDSVTAGLVMVEKAGAYYVETVMSGGPAGEAGVRRGDRVARVDGIPTEESPLLDQRCDDAYRSRGGNHLLNCREGREARLLLERRPGEFRVVEVTAARYSSLRADLLATRTIARGGRSLGYLPLTYLYRRDTSRLLAEALGGKLSQCDGLILDLRGRGGSRIAMLTVLSTFDPKRWKKPVVALIDRNTRSAKEVIADKLARLGGARLVGEPTAGAVVGAVFVNVGSDTYLLRPQAGAPRRHAGIEGRGVTPDVRVLDAARLSAGADPILERGVAVLVEILDG